MDPYNSALSLTEDPLRPWYFSPDEEISGAFEEKYVKIERTSEKLAKHTAKKMNLIRLHTFSMQTELIHLREENRHLKAEVLKNATRKMNPRKPKNTTHCYHCSIQGHIAKTCPSKNEKMPRTKVPVSVQVSTDVSTSLQRLLPDRASMSTKRQPSRQRQEQI